LDGLALDLQDQTLTRAELKDYAITHNAVSISSGAITLDFATGNSFEVTLTENVTSITIANPPATGNLGEAFIRFKQDATGGRTVGGWPAAVKWPGGTAPTITSPANAVDKVTLTTDDAGTTYLGDFSQDYQ
ncbi:MAG: hypothetical protein V3U18_09895, partial [Alphaproteobacteria bacterium]